MRRIIFLNRYFWPDRSATSQLLSDLAFHLAGRGREVVAICGRQRYDEAAADLPKAETANGVRIERVANTRFGRSGLFGRGVDYLSLYAAIYRAVLRLAEPGDVIVSKTDPPMLCIPAMAAARRRKLRLVNWIQDLYPEIAVELAVPFVRGPAAAAMFRLRDAALRQAAANVAIGERMAERLRARGMPGEQIAVIANWCDDEDIRPLAAGDNPLRREWGLEGRFVVGYSGHLGRPHEYETMLAAAERLSDDPRILFLLIGGGSGIDALRRRAAERGVSAAFRFFPYQSRAKLKHSLTVSDVHWVSLKPQLDGLLVPSKIYGIAAAGRPFLAIAAPEGEIARLVREHGCGLVVAPGQGAEAAAALRSLCREPQRVAAMGARARAMLEAHFTRRQAFARWDELLEAVG